MKVIGKANKFYTLWEITNESRPLGNGRTYNVTIYSFIKNLSFNKEDAMAKVPGAEVDESIHGHRSFERIKYPTPPADEFRYGKYCGTKVVDCNDIDYLAWAWNNSDSIFSEESRPIVESKLVDAGYRKLNNSTCYSDPTTVAEWEAEQEKLDEFINSLNNNEIHIVLNTNLNDEGVAYLLNGNVEIKFNDISEFYYNGYNYYLPLDDKGKAKRIKNKKLVITAKNIEIAEENRNTWNPAVKIMVDKFKIEK